MGGVTAKGYPYPTGTDRVMDGDNAMQSLAEAVDAKAGASHGGVVVIPLSAIGTPASATVTFPAGRFAAAPAVVCSGDTTAPDRVFTSVQSVTSTGCLLWGNRTTGSTMTVQVRWIARNEG